jgi:hypothetical protein
MQNSFRIAKGKFMYRVSINGSMLTVSPLMGAVTSFPVTYATTLRLLGEIHLVKNSGPADKILKTYFANQGWVILSK